MNKSGVENPTICRSNPTFCGQPIQVERLSEKGEGEKGKGKRSRTESES